MVNNSREGEGSIEI